MVNKGCWVSCLKHHNNGYADVETGYMYCLSLCPLYFFHLLIIKAPPSFPPSLLFSFSSSFPHSVSYSCPLTHTHSPFVKPLGRCILFVGLPIHTFNNEDLSYRIITQLPNTENLTLILTLILPKQIPPIKSKQGKKNFIQGLYS